jgi:DnaJ-class molecular chaperone
MANYEIHAFCGKCQGTGSTSSQYGGSASCSACNGDGRRTVADLDLSDVEDKLDDIMDKLNDIKEKVDAL